MSPQLQASFELFINRANKGGLHSLDWDRFYKFVIALHSSGAELSTKVLKDRLISDRFSEDQISHLTEFYEHGRRMLELA